MERELKPLKLSQLQPSKHNPRKDFDKKSLEELAASIREHGLISPILARPLVDDGSFEIVAGERRYRAAKLAGLKEVNCVIEPMTEEQAREAQIIENLQREDISALEEAQAYQEFLKAQGDRMAIDSEQRATVEALAKRIGKSNRHVYARLELLRLAAPIKTALERGKIQASHAQELVPLKPEQQREMLGVITDEYAYNGGGRMSVQEVRDEIRSRYEPKKPPKPEKISPREKARRVKIQAAEKKRQAAYDRSQAVSEEKRKLRVIVNQRAVALLWPRMKKANAKERDWLLSVYLRYEAGSSNGLAAAAAVASGKPLPRGGVRDWKGAVKQFEKMTLPERVGLLVLANVIQRMDYDTSKELEKLFTWAGADRNAIARKIQAQDKAHAKADAIGLAKVKAGTAGKAKPVLQTSAKPKGKATAGKRKAKK